MGCSSSSPKLYTLSPRSAASEMSTARDCAAIHQHYNSVALSINVQHLHTTALGAKHSLLAWFAIQGAGGCTD